MIKANELRIGNWVDTVYNVPYIKITEIKEVVICGENCKCMSYGSLKPIPLTEEILLKCGFEKQGGFWFVKGDIKIEITLSRGYFRYAGFVRLKYLHQLQNLYFALTGQELEVSWS